jgi:hypothetical protein
MRPLFSGRAPARAGALAVVLLGAMRAEPTWAQGCVPSRFTTPAVGALGDIYLQRGTWQVAFAFRSLRSDELIVGKRVRNDLAPSGQPAMVNNESLNTSASYGVTDRLSVTVNVPLQQGMHEAFYADSLRHRNSSSGLGDISVAASYWLRSAEALRPGGNVAVGLGVKIPTGGHDDEGRSWRADGSWGVIANAKGFQPVGERTYLFAGGSYTMNPRKTTSVLRSPGTTVFWSSPDTWEGSAGGNVRVSSGLGLSLTFAGMFYGTPRQDLIGGRDAGARLPATVGYLSSGIGAVRARHAVTVSVPIRIYMDFQTSYLDDAGGRPGGGGLSRRMILASYSVRF